MPQKNIYKPLFFIFFTLFLVAIVGIIAYSVIQNQNAVSLQTYEANKKIIPTQAPLPTPTGTTKNSSIKTVTPTIIKDLTQGWKTYTDSVYKYSIKYPSDWILTKKNDGSISLITMERNKISKQDPIFGPNIEIFNYNSLSAIPGYSSNLKTLEDLVKKEELNSVKQISIGSADGFSGYTNYPDHRTYLQKGNRIYYIFDDSIEENQIYQQIINTLVFFN